MPIRSILIMAVTAVAAAGCKSVDCGEGTIERSGVCVASDESVGNAMCGPFTELQAEGGLKSCQRS